MQILNLVRKLRNLWVCLKVWWIWIWQMSCLNTIKELSINYWKISELGLRISNKLLKLKKWKKDRTWKTRSSSKGEQNSWGYNKSVPNNKLCKSNSKRYRHKKRYLGAANPYQVLKLKARKFTKTFKYLMVITMLLLISKSNKSMEILKNWGKLKKIPEVFKISQIVSTKSIISTREDFKVESKRTKNN